jgi:hypothetical protein
MELLPVLRGDLYGQEPGRHGGAVTIEAEVLGPEWEVHLPSSELSPEGPEPGSAASRAWPELLHFPGSS